MNRSINNFHDCSNCIINIDKVTYYGAISIYCDFVSLKCLICKCCYSTQNTIRSLIRSIRICKANNAIIQTVHISIKIPNEVFKHVHLMVCSFLEIVLHAFAQNNDLVRIFHSVLFALVDKLRAKS